jgi:hypothetical protein
LRPTGRFDEFDGDVLVGNRSRVRAVPGPPVGVDTRIGHRGQGFVRRAPVIDAGVTINRRTQQGMAEPNRCSNGEQPGIDRGVGGIDGQVQFHCGALDSRRIADGVGSGQQHQLPGDARHFGQPREVLGFNAT